jgi:hypothetical protein
MLLIYGQRMRYSILGLRLPFVMTVFFTIFKEVNKACMGSSARLNLTPALAKRLTTNPMRKKYNN